MIVLKFSKANAKTQFLQTIPELQPYLQGNRKVYSLDLLSGWSCPGAQDCLAKVYVEQGRKRLKDGPKTQFRCFSASQEVAYPAVYRNRKANFDLLKAFRYKMKIADLIHKALPTNLGILRYHVGGGFFSRAYFEAAVEVAKRFPDRLFYAYMKSLHFIDFDKMIDPARGIYLPNFLLTASRGGKYDHLIDKYGIRTAKVVFSEHETDLPIDHDDSHAATPGSSFALLLHGVQPKGSEASKALVQLKGKGSYRK